MNEYLYEGKNFKTWTTNNLAEVLCEEWANLNPTLLLDRKSFGRKVTSITFKDEVRVTLNIMKQRYSDTDKLQVVFELSLSPEIDDLKTHILNTLDFSDFIGTSSSITGELFFTIGKKESWNGSMFQETARIGKLVIEAMLKFETCFSLLIEDETKLGNETFDMRPLEQTQHLNRVKAYRLAEIYGHPEKLDQAVAMIKRGLPSNEFARNQIETVYQRLLAGKEDLHYTKDMIERIKAQ